jgi:thiol-disulfide isomerase/thioredoxin
MMVRHKKTHMSRREMIRLAGQSAPFLCSGTLTLNMLSCAAPQNMSDAPSQDPTRPLAGLTDFSGNEKKLPALIGSVTILDFWASWCAPCRQGFRYMDQLFGSYAGDGLKVFGISVDTDPAAARRFYSRLRPHFPVAWDKSGEVRKRFRVQGLPTSILLNADARVVQRHEGFDPESHQLLATHVRRMVRGI